MASEAIATIDTDELRPRQLTLQFDYEGIGIREEVGEELEALAETIEDYHRSTRENDVVAYMKIAESVAEAQKKFRKHKSSAPWKAWLSERMLMKPAEADKAVVVFKVLGKKQLGDLAGIPAKSLYLLCRPETPAELRNNVLKLAKKSFLTDKQVAAAVTVPEPGQIKKGPKVPQDHDELKSHIAAKVSPLRSKLGDELRLELPEVLREIAAEIAAELTAAK